MGPVLGVHVTTCVVWTIPIGCPDVGFSQDPEKYWCQPEGREGSFTPCDLHSSALINTGHWAHRKQCFSMCRLHPRTLCTCVLHLNATRLMGPGSSRHLCNGLNGWGAKPHLAVWIYTAVVLNKWSFPIGSSSVCGEMKWDRRYKNSSSFIQFETFLRIAKHWLPAVWS